jgi:YidC/Oxa1 family membrane protein insertase
MDKRSIVALALIALIILAGGVIRARLYPAPTVVADTALVTPTPGVDSLKAVAVPQTGTTSAVASKAPAALPTVVAHADTETISLSDRIARFVNVGAAPVDIGLPKYKDLKRHVGSLSITPTRGSLMHFRIVNGADTIRLDDIAFTATQAGQTLEFASTSPAVRVNYEMTPDNYLTHTTVSLAGAAAGAKLIVDLAPDLRSGEADTTEDFRHLAYSFKRTKGDVESILLQKLDTTQTTSEIGPLEWVAIRNKYFVYAVIAADSMTGFSQFDLRGGHRRAGGFPTGLATATIAMRSNGAAFDLYTGPQSC